MAHRAFIVNHPMTIVIVNDAAFIRGGADKVAIASAQGLARVGHRVIFFAGRGPVEPSLAAEPGVVVHCLDLKDPVSSGGGLQVAATTMWNRTAAQAFAACTAHLARETTIVHVHLYTQSLSPAVPHAATRLGFATVLTLHDYFLTCPNGAYFEHPAGRVCHRRPLSFSCITCQCDARSPAHKLWRVARAIVQQHVAKLSRHLSCLVAVSEFGRDTARRHLPTNISIEVVANPVDVRHAPPVAVAANENFVFSGRLEFLKGAQIFAAAAADAGVSAVFCGAGPLEPRLRTLNPQARFTGWIGAEEIARELDQARALVFPSLWPETFGLSAVEAIARGIPVLGARGTAAMEYIADGDNGLLFDPNSPGELAAQLRRLGDPHLAASLGTEAYRRYWQRPWTLDRHIAALEDLYLSVLAKLAHVRRARRATPTFAPATAP